MFPPTVNDNGPPKGRPALPWPTFRNEAASPAPRRSAGTANSDRGPQKRAPFSRFEARWWGSARLAAESRKLGRSASTFDKLYRPLTGGVDMLPLTSFLLLPRFVWAPAH